MKLPSTSLAVVRVIGFDISVMILELSHSTLQAGSVVNFLHFPFVRVLFLREWWGRRE